MINVSHVSVRVSGINVQKQIKQVLARISVVTLNDIQLIYLIFLNVAIVLSNWESGIVSSLSRIVQRYCDVLKDLKMNSLVSPNVLIPSNIGF